MSRFDAFRIHIAVLRPNFVNEAIFGRGLRSLVGSPTSSLINEPSQKGWSQISQVSRVGPSLLIIMGQDSKSNSKIAFSLNFGIFAINVTDK